MNSHEMVRFRCIIVVLVKNVNCRVSVTRVLTTLENMEISGNLFILENSENLKFTQGIYQMLFFVTQFVSRASSYVHNCQ